MQNSVKIDAKFHQNHSKNPSKPNQKKRWAPLSARTYRWASFQPVRQHFCHTHDRYR